LVKALEESDEHDVDVGDEFVRGMKFALWLTKPTSIKGLKSALKKVGYKG
jgi:hypothetical protein